MGRRLCANSRRYRASWLAECLLLILQEVGDRIGDSDGLSRLRTSIIFASLALCGFVDVMVFCPMEGCHD